MAGRLLQSCPSSEGSDEQENCTPPAAECPGHVSRSLLPRPAQGATSPALCTQATPSAAFLHLLGGPCSPLAFPLEVIPRQLRASTLWLACGLHLLSQCLVRSGLGEYRDLHFKGEREFPVSQGLPGLGLGVGEPRPEPRAELHSNAASTQEPSKALFLQCTPLCADHTERLTFKGADSTCGVLGTPAGTPSPFSSPTSLPHPVESNQAASKTFPDEKANRPSICSSEPGAPSGDLGTKPRCAASEAGSQVVHQNSLQEDGQPEACRAPQATATRPGPRAPGGQAPDHRGHVKRCSLRCRVTKN